MKSVFIVVSEAPAQSLYMPIKCLNPLLIINVKLVFAGFRKVLYNLLNFPGPNIVKLGFCPAESSNVFSAL